MRDAEALGGRFTGARIIAQPPFEDKTYARAPVYSTTRRTTHLEVER
ncbi:MAG TPA: hypothetical protein VGO56_11800 [Pyrinomonadaceae bacterium]|nr:hypothetical protein [Pyrinomonadaceae bacterium]